MDGQTARHMMAAYTTLAVLSLVHWYIDVKDEDVFLLVASQVKSIFTKLRYFCERPC